ncbi:phosphoserine phosphatase SerB [Corynebacterium sp. zg254]|uniref:phosphoserine phosphatase n=1 Tax=Corynebacterium zhongnanshanii TaxID=2768834 RepID=A0ABQ6VE23_9CORY|nr:phosphoserine phosphatase SerB [Corynebacterium zhongnanshanii]MCR5914631.1 phosphoserine phosphatase SerB [Corynebacterium sp. zg254]
MERHCERIEPVSTNNETEFHDALQDTLSDGKAPAIITITGKKDKPGVTAAFFTVLTEYAVQLLDIEQSVFRGSLSLAALVGVAPDELPALEQSLVDTLEPYGMSVNVDSDEHLSSTRPQSSHVMVVIGRPVTAAHIFKIGETLANHGANIDAIHGIADYPVTGLELNVTVADPTPGGGVELRKALAALTREIGVDIAIERAGLARRSKRLICFDVDSTLIQQEVIEMLAAFAGKEAEVAEVTERAMRGELDFAESLHERVKTLAGLDASVVDRVARSIELTPGARTTIRTLKRLGYKTGVVSGGFIQVIEPLARDLGLDFARANTLEIKDGVLTGRVIGPVIDRKAKAESLKEFAWSNGIKLNQTVAVGDGANDIDMLSTAGLGIAFNAKPALREVADAAVNHPFLDQVLFILGIPRYEIEDADLRDGTYRRPQLEI